LIFLLGQKASKRLCHAITHKVMESGTYCDQCVYYVMLIPC